MKNPKDLKILVCLSLLDYIDYEVLDKTYKALGDMQVLIKHHPMQLMNVFWKLMKRYNVPWPENFKSTNLPIEAILPWTDIFIVAQSSTIAEATYLGIRTIIVGMNTNFDIIPIDCTDIDYEIIYTPEELRKAVLEGKTYFRSTRNLKQYLNYPKEDM